MFSNYPIFYPHTDSTKTVDERPRRVRSVGFCYLLLLCGEGQERWVRARDESVVDGRWLSAVRSAVRSVEERGRGTEVPSEGEVDGEWRMESDFVLAAACSICKFDMCFFMQKAFAKIPF